MNTVREQSYEELVNAPTVRVHVKQLRAESSASARAAREQVDDLAWCRLIEDSTFTVLPTKATGQKIKPVVLPNQTPVWPQVWQAAGIVMIFMTAAGLLGSSVYVLINGPWQLRLVNLGVYALLACIGLAWWRSRPPSFCGGVHGD